MELRESGVAEIDFGGVVHVRRAAGAPTALVVCEHASRRIPAGMGAMGLSEDALRSHIAWDPGAAAVADRLAALMGATLVKGGVSRLVYDCNRPPEADSAIPEQSEVFAIPANKRLGEQERAQRVRGVYEPFRRAVAAEISRHRARLNLLITIHSFTPVYAGRARDVEIGVLHGQDATFAQAMLRAAPRAPYDVRLNEPYAAADGVAHTLDLHGAANGLASVMIEIRNDLIADEAAQRAMADHLADWIEAARIACESDRA